MRIMVPRFSRILFAGLGLLAMPASHATATTFTQYTSSTEGYNGSDGIDVYFTTDGSDPSQWWNWDRTHTTGEAFTSQFWSSGNSNAAPVGSPFLTFCVDLANDLRNGTKINASVNDSQSGNGPNDSDGNPRDIGAAGWVMKTYINSSTSAPTGLSSGTTDEKYAAIQIAIWKVTYEHTGTSINNSHEDYRFYTSDSVVMTLAQNILNAYHAATNPDSTTIGFINYPPNSGQTSDRYSQDMIYLNHPQAVPEPATILSAGLGAIALAWSRRRSRRAA